MSHFLRLGKLQDLSAFFHSHATLVLVIQPAQEAGPCALVTLDMPSMVPWAMWGLPLLQGIQAAPSSCCKGPQKTGTATSALFPLLLVSEPDRPGQDLVRIWALTDRV